MKRTLLAFLYCLALNLTASANVVTFSGDAFSSFYGAENLTVDAGGDLHVPTT